MIHTVADPEFIGTVTLEVKAFGGVDLRIDGQPAPPGPSRGTFLLNTTDGQRTAMVKPSFTRTAPSLNLDGRIIEVGEGIPPWLLAIAALPIVLAGVGGAIGGGLGGMGAAINFGIAKMPKPIPVRIAIMGAVTAGTVGIFIAIAGAIAG